ncbi:MAG: DUF1684 domain-containing protein [Acidobacteriota bacterium]|nr:DUF1684 domain-containing protein [Acidobacteriota bacterium]
MSSRTSNTSRRPWFFALLLVSVSCASPPLSYDQEISAWRVEKDAAFRTSDSPVPEARRASFTGLVYYDVNPSMRVAAALVSNGASSQIIEMDTTAGNRERMRVIGKLEFTINGERRELTAFVRENARDTARLFVPFGDATNRGETYGGGRYLDLTRSPIGLYDLDFNRAYNPFCVYDTRYECPLPPRENRLPVEIRAGEKMPEGKS